MLVSPHFQAGVFVCLFVFNSPAMEDKGFRLHAQTWVWVGPHCLGTTDPPMLPLIWGSEPLPWHDPGVQRREQQVDGLTCRVVGSREEVGSPESCNLNPFPDIILLYTPQRRGGGGAWASPTGLQSRPYVQTWQLVTASSGESNWSRRCFFFFFATPESIKIQ